MTKIQVQWSPFNFRDKTEQETRDLILDAFQEFTKVCGITFSDNIKVLPVADKVSFAQYRDGNIYLSTWCTVDDKFIISAIMRTIAKSDTINMDLTEVWFTPSEVKALQDRFGLAEYMFEPEPVYRAETALFNLNNDLKDKYNERTALIKRRKVAVNKQQQQDLTNEIAAIEGEIANLVSSKERLADVLHSISMDWEESQVDQVITSHPQGKRVKYQKDVFAFKPRELDSSKAEKLEKAECEPLNEN